MDGEVISRIGPGLLTLLGIGKGDQASDLDWLIPKILKLRIFEDDAGKMNLSLLDKKYEHLIVSQFTLFGDASKGNRPSFVDAAPPDQAKALYDQAITLSQSLGAPTQGGRFQAHMKVELVNDGPVTLWIAGRGDSAHA